MRQTLRATNNISMIAPILVMVTAVELLSQWVGDSELASLFGAIRVISITCLASAWLLMQRDAASNA